MKLLFSIRKVFRRLKMYNLIFPYKIITRIDRWFLVYFHCTSTGLGMHRFKRLPMESLLLGILCETYHWNIIMLVWISYICTLFQRNIHFEKMINTLATSNKTIFASMSFLFLHFQQPPILSDLQCIIRNFLSNVDAIFVTQ